MKRIKKIMALMLAAIMMMAMSVTAFAAEGAAGTHTLTVNVKTGEGVPAQTLKDQTIYLYKLFDVTESGTTGAKNYAYTVNTAAGYKDVLVAALNTATITTWHGSHHGNRSQSVEVRIPVLLLPCCFEERHIRQIHPG